MMIKMVDGKEMVCSSDEECLIRMKWDLNTKYPDYRGHLMFDGVSEPKHDIAQCKKTHTILVNAEIQKKLDALRLLIEEAEEKGDPLNLNGLFQTRRALKSRLNPDLSSMNVIDDLKAHLEKVKAL